MGRDQYKVDVLHFINPHLIWVLVKKEHEDEFHFEQIGIFGILPQNVTFGGMDCVLKVERCEEWMPAASVAMKRCFLQAAEVWFSPTYVDKISTVFGDDTHKYGDIIIIKKNGEEVDLLQEIVNSDFAYEDEDLFDLKLRGNNPKTQLNYVTMHEVLKTIEDSYATRSIPKTAWLAALKKQPELHQKEKPLDSSPKAQKLDSSDPDNAEILSKEKLDYLKLCEDVDEISVGRGCSRNSLTSGKPSIVSVALKKKLEWLESQNIANRPKVIKPVSPTAHADTKTNTINSDVNKKAEVLEVEENNNKISPKNGNLLSGGDKKNNKIKGKKPRQPVNNNETLVAYGPAGLQANKFTIKPWTPKIEKEEPVVEETRKPEPEPVIEEKKNEDVYANTDSEVYVPRHITSKSLLLRLRREPRACYEGVLKGRSPVGSTEASGLSTCQNAYANDISHHQRQKFSKKNT